MVRRLGAQMGRRLSKIAHVIVPVHVFECAGASLAAMDGHCATESARPLSAQRTLAQVDSAHTPGLAAIGPGDGIWIWHFAEEARGPAPYQRAVGNALEAAYATTLTGPAATLYTNLLMTGTPNALSQLSGEGITAAQNAAFASGRMFNSLMMDQGAFWRSGETADSEGVTYREAPLAYAAEKNKPTPAAFKELKAPPLAYQPRNWRVWTGGRADELRNQRDGCVASGRRLYRSHPQGCEARGPAGGAGVEVRAGHQCRDSQDARPHRAGYAARERRRGDRIAVQLAASPHDRNWHICRVFLPVSMPMV